VPRLPDLRAKSAEKLKAKELRVQVRPARILSDQVFTVARLPQPKPGPDATMAVEPTISSLALEAVSLPSPADVDPSDPSSSMKPLEQARRHYVRQLHQVIEEADIVLLVLDARDPEGCRSRLVEDEVRRREHEGKRLVFVLNKIGVHSMKQLRASTHGYA
jgi:nuclear GTP-binding protein